MTIRKYEMPELTPGKNIPGAKKFEAPQFARHRDLSEVDATHRQLASFHLDQNVSSQLGLAQRQAEEAEAEVQREIARRWEKNAEQAEAAGYTKGLEEGKQEAYKAELPRIQERVQRLDNLLKEIDGMRDLIFSANESFLMDIVARVAGMVALKEISVDQDYVRRVVTTLLHQLGTKDDVKIHLSAADFANAASLHQQLEKEFGKMTNTTIEPSEEISAGGCRVETRFAVVDASLNAQIQNAVDSLKA